jgi:hypothetical protein
MDNFGIFTREAPRTEVRINIVRESVSALAISRGRHNRRDRLSDTPPSFPTDFLIHAIVDPGPERRTEHEKSDQDDQHKPNRTAPGAGYCIYPGAGFCN